MGAFISSFLQIINSENWSKYGRAEKLRQIFGAYEAQDCWAVVRRFRQLDDGTGWIDYESLQKLVGAEEFSLLFIWDMYNQQNELVNAIELLTCVSLFSNARIEEKGSFLLSLFDNSKSGSCTAEEICKMCVTVAGVIQRCTSVVVKGKELIPKIREELPELVDVYAAEVESVGEPGAFKVKRVFSAIELPKLLDVFAETYQESPLAAGPPAMAAPPPPPNWGISAGAAAPKGGGDANQGIAAALAAEAAKKPKAGEERIADLPHIGWMAKLDEALAEPGTGVWSPREEVASVHRWMVMHGGDFKNVVAKNPAAFRRSWHKCVCHALAVPGDAIQVIQVMPGSIVVEFKLQYRDAEGLAVLLKEQCSNPHSLLRTSEMGPHFRVGGDLFHDAPKLAPKCTREGPVEMVDQETQVSGYDLTLPKAPPSQAKAALNQKAPPSPSNKDMSAIAELSPEDEEASAELRDALKQLEVERRRLKLAEAGRLKAVRQVREKEEVIAALKAKHSHHTENVDWSTLFGVSGVN